MNEPIFASGLVIARRDPILCQPIHEALTASGIASLRLVTRYDRPEEVIARADTEGGVPIVVMWEEQRQNTRLIADLITCDTLPGRPYVLVVPSDVIAAVSSEELDTLVPHSTERVLVVSIGDLGTPATRELLRLHLSRTCASYLGRTRRTRGIAPAPITEMPVGERNINNIERRIMQRGMFRVAALRIPRF
jgi:hypothetical protein